MAELPLAGLELSERQAETAGLDEAGFVACAFHAGDPERFEPLARRLADSCRRFRVPFRIFAANRVHHSITPAGCDDLAGTKANFIHHMLDDHPGVDVLYLDVDLVWMAEPRVFQEPGEAFDFAVYNWLADETNHAYLPLDRNPGGSAPESAIYRYSHGIPLRSASQLICSGGVQYYANNRRSRSLLRAWQACVADNPGAADDKCLDYAFNFLVPEAERPRPMWLDKAHLRLPWWPHVEPVILHPEAPASTRRPAVKAALSTAGKRYRLEQTRPSRARPPFPPDRLIDTGRGLSFRVDGNRVVDPRPLAAKFWIYPQDYGLGS